MNHDKNTKIKKIDITLESEGLLCESKKITLNDIRYFLVRGHKVIIIFIILGLILAGFYLLTTPKLYDGRAQIILTEYNMTLRVGQGGLRLDDPSQMIARHSFPTLYSEKEVIDCGVKNQASASARLAKLVKITPVKGANNIIEINFQGSSPDITERCLAAIVQLIKNNNDEKLKEYKNMLLNLLKSNELIIDQVDKKNMNNYATSYEAVKYISVQQEAVYLRSENSHLKFLLNEADRESLKLSAPIYVDVNPNSPNKIMVIIIGAIVGLFFGLIVAFANQNIKFNVFRDNH
jgi:hypothetical protein